MKKNGKLLFLLVLFLLCFISIDKVEAYAIRYRGVVKGSSPSIRKYNATINGTSYMAYCLDPGRVAAYSSNTIISLDPSKQPVGSGMYKFTLASQYLYQRMKENGWTNADDIGYAVGNTAFRILARTYYDGGLKKSSLAGAYNAYANMGAGVRRIAGVQNGINLATEAIQFAEQNGGTEYSDLVSSGTMHGVGWTTVRSETVQLTGTNNYQLTVEIEPSTSDIYSIDYSKFTIGFLNTTAPIVSQSSTQGTGNHAVISVVFDATNWDKNDLGAYVDAYYCDPNSASSMLYLLSTGGYSQRFIVVLPGTAGTCDAGGGNPHGGSRTKITIPVDSETCLCDTSTGMYTYKKIENGNVTLEKTWAATSPSPSGIDKSKCPGTCEKKPICQIIDNQPYCKDGEKCDQEKYDKECKHTCQTPEQSGDGNYYCNESSPGAGDGPICTEKEYRRDCLGEVACNPNVTVPSDCNNFDTASTYNGKISDINKVSTTCNPDVNQVKSCVLDNKDATGASFEATSELSGNPYCKVWCAEDYSFELPTAQYSKSGGYFTLSTKIIGTRDCYVGGADNPKEAIDTTKFNNDLTTAQKEVIDAWNEYNHWKVAASIAATEVDSSCTHESHDYSCNCSTDSEGNESCDTCHCSGCSATGKVVTKNWTYTIYDYNGNASTRSDSYSDGKAAKCGHGSCTGKIGHNPDQDHKNNRDSAKRTLIAAVEKLNSIIANYNSCTGVIANTNYSSNLTNVNPSSTTESSWENDMKFDPKVQFIYNEDYMSQLNGEFKQVNDTESSNSMFCSGDTDATYKCQSGSSSSIQTAAQNYLTCDENNCGFKTAQISTAKWIRKSKTHTAEYKPNNQFSTYTQYGTIKFKWDQCNGNDCLWTNLPDDAIPVMLAQKSGVFPFKFTFSQIGQSNATGNIGNGRLIGETVSVLTEYNKLDKSETCNSGGKVSATADGGYVCHYLNNCDDCDFICEDGVCDFDDDGDLCGTCDLTCETCLFDGDRAMYSFRIVSLNNLFTNTERRIGYNWYNGGTSGRPENEKAKVTREEIDEAGESIYDKPQYEFVLEPGDMKNIREYNNAAGSYTNSKVPDEYTTSLNTDNAIYCEKVTLNGKEYNVRCKSSFLDLIENSGKTYASEMTRITSNNSNVGGESNNGWELYTETDYCKDGKCLTHGIGPSWRIRSVS